jgi:hypothetical protein
VSVAIAHARGASVAVVEAVVAWRAQLALSKSTTTVQTVSVFWEGKNYLEKVRVVVLDFGWFPRPLLTARASSRWRRT